MVVTAARPRAATTVVAAYLAAVAIVCLAATTLIPNHLVMPMGQETHLMAFLGPANPGAHWTLFFGMGGMVIAYALIIPTLVGLLRPRAAELGTLLLGGLTAAFAAYLARWGAGLWLSMADSHGLTDTLSVWAFLLTPIPILIAAVRLLASGTLDGRLVYAGAALLHVGMFLAMCAADLFGGWM